MDRALAEVQLAGDRTVRLASGNETEDLDLPSSEPVDLGTGVRGRDDLVQPSQIRTRTEPLEGLPGGGEFEPRTVMVSERTAGLPDQDVQCGPLVWGILLLPGTDGPPQQWQRACGIALGERQRASDGARLGLADRCRQLRGDILSICDGIAVRRDLPLLEVDGHRGLQQVQAVGRRGHLGQRPTDAG